MENPHKEVKPLPSLYGYSDCQSYRLWQANILLKASVGDVSDLVQPFHSSTIESQWGLVVSGQVLSLQYLVSVWSFVFPAFRKRTFRLFLSSWNRCWREETQWYYLLIWQRLTSLLTIIPKPWVTLQVRWTTDVRIASTQPPEESARPRAHPSAIRKSGFTVAIPPIYNLEETCAVGPNLFRKG